VGMNSKLQNDLSKRERQVMAIIYKRKNASVNDVLKDIPNPPSYSAVRSVVNILEDKGFIKHKKHGKKYVYSPTISRKKATSLAVKQLITTYFDNSTEKAVTTMLEMHNDDLTGEDFQRLSMIIERARKEAEK
jgi:predicted transcriptional regulator